MTLMVTIPEWAAWTMFIYVVWPLLAAIGLFVFLKWWMML